MIRFINDDFNKQGTFAVAGGLRLTELATLETAWLRVLDFDIWVDPIELTLIQDKMLKAPLALCDLDLSMMASSLKSPRVKEQETKNTQKTPRSPQSVPVDLITLSTVKRQKCCGSFILSI